MVLSRHHRFAGEGTFEVNGSGWARGLKVGAGGKGLVGHAGVVLLRHLADRVGLTAALAGCFIGGGPGWLCRGTVLAQTACAIVAGAVNLSDVERLAAHHHGLFGATGSDSTIRRTLEEIDDVVIARLARARARARARVWTLLCLRPGGFPWLTVAGKHLRGWLVIDMDATIITCESKKQGAAPTFKRTYGFHPLAAWCANTTESWRCSCGPGMPERTTLVTTSPSWGGRWRRFRVWSGPRSWSGSTAPGRPTSCRAPRRGVHDPSTGALHGRVEDDARGRGRDRGAARHGVVSDARPGR